MENQKELSDLKAFLAAITMFTLLVTLWDIITSEHIGVLSKSVFAWVIWEIMSSL